MHGLVKLFTCVHIYIYGMVTEMQAHMYVEPTCVYPIPRIYSIHFRDAYSIHFRYACMYVCMWNAITQVHDPQPFS